MAYGRRYRRFGYRRRGRRYSVENYQMLFTIASGQNAQQGGFVIGATTVQGIRKVKNFRLTLATTDDKPISWALVYVPENMTASVMNISAGDPVTMYEPNQNVIMAGLLSAASTNSQTFSTRLSRNLNAGDQVALLIKPLSPASEAKTLVAQLTYAIAF